MSTEEILAQALRLPRAERALLAEEVLSSLEDPDEQVAAAWARELERRSNDIAEGRVQPVDWETARDQILKELEQRRAGRFILRLGPNCGPRLFGMTSGGWA